MDVVDRVAGKLVLYMFCIFHYLLKSNSTMHILDLVGRMTAEEKVSQLGTGAPAVDRLAIPGYQW